MSEKTQQVRDELSKAHPDKTWCVTTEDWKYHDGQRSTEYTIAFLPGMNCPCSLFKGTELGELSKKAMDALAINGKMHLPGIRE